MKARRGHLPSASFHLYVSFAVHFPRETLI